MESWCHFEKSSTCITCGREPEELLSCPHNHRYCTKCYKELKLLNNGKRESCSKCSICNFTGPFTQNYNPPHSQIRSRCNSRISRMSSHHQNLDHYKYDLKPCLKHHQTTEEDTFRAFIGMSKEEFRQCQLELTQQQHTHNLKPALQPPTNRVRSKLNLPSQSRRPLKCPHGPCRRTVAVSNFVSHFKNEHPDVRACSVERGRELCIPYDVTLIEHGGHHCVAMVTVYEVNNIDTVQSRSSESVKRTCNKFCQKVPINTFWLMVTGSPEKKTKYAYCVFWLFTNSEESYKCTIEVASKRDSQCLSAYCDVNSSYGKEDFSCVIGNLNCLLVPKPSLCSLLKEGRELNLRVAVH